MGAFDDLIPGNKKRAGAFDDLIPAQPATPLWQGVGQQVGRGLGLTARDVLQGAGGVVGIASDPIASAMGVPHARETMGMMSDKLGLPSPQTPLERVSGQASEAMVGGAATMGLGSAAPAASIARKVLTANPAMQTVSAASGGAAGGIAHENDATPGMQLLSELAGGIGPSLVTTLPQMALRAIVRGGAAGQQVMQAAIDDFKAAGTTPTIGQATQRPVWRGVESILAKLPGSSGVMTNKAAAQGQELGLNVTNLADTLSPRMDATRAGQSIERGVGQFAQNVGAQRKALYWQADQHIPPNTPMQLPNTQQTLGRLTTPTPGAEATTAGEVNPKISQLAQNVSTDMASGSMPYSAAQAVRSRIGQQLNNTGLTVDKPTAEYSALYGSLSNDMAAAARKQGPEAAQAMSRANTYYKVSADRLKSLDHVVGKDAPEAIFNAAMSGTKDGATTLTKIMRSLPQQATRDVAAAVLKRLGQAPASLQNAATDAFNSSTFLSNWSKFSPAARNALFDRLGPDFRARVDAITRVTSNLRDGSKVFSNPSGTAAAHAQNIGYGALATSGLGALIGHPLPLAITGGGMGLNYTLAQLMTRSAQSAANPTHIPYGVLTPSALGQLQQAQQRKRN
jgi:hypothetical protein